VTAGSGRRLRVVPPLPGQLSLDLPGIPTVDQLAQLVVADAARSRPAPPGQPGQTVRPQRLVPTRDADRVGPAVPARVPVAVWAVWDGEDLVGVYAQESVARGDAAVGRRPRGTPRADRGLPAAAGVHRVPAHPPVAVGDSASAGPVTGRLPR